MVRREEEEEASCQTKLFEGAERQASIEDKVKLCGRKNNCEKEEIVIVSLVQRAEALFELQENNVLASDTLGP